MIPENNVLRLLVTYSELFDRPGNYTLAGLKDLSREELVPILEDCISNKKDAVKMGYTSSAAAFFDTLSLMKNR